MNSSSSQGQDVRVCQTDVTWSCRGQPDVTWSCRGALVGWAGLHKHVSQTGCWVLSLNKYSQQQAVVRLWRLSTILYKKNIMMYLIYQCIIEHITEIMFIRYPSIISNNIKIKIYLIWASPFTREAKCWIQKYQTATFSEIKVYHWQ